MARGVLIGALVLGACGTPAPNSAFSSSASPAPASSSSVPSSSPAPDSALRVASTTSAAASGESSDGSRRVTAEQADVAHAGPLPSAGSPAPWPVGSKVLHVGDSFAGALGVPLGRRLEERGVRSVLKSTDASYLTDWAWDGSLQKYLWRFNPDLVLITLGANELKIGDPAARSKTIRKLVSLLDGRPCVWVAIPLWEGPQNGLLEVIRDSCAPCRFLDTNQLLDVANMPRLKDGIHPTASAREAWADVVIRWLETHRAPDAASPWSLRGE